MTHLCGRCKKEVYRYSKCNYCKRDVCSNCVKSSKKGSNTVRLVICKDCWTNMTRRKAYKNKRSAS